MAILCLKKVMMLEIKKNFGIIKRNIIKVYSIKSMLQLKKNLEKTHVTYFYVQILI
jgi:hypothetical protein